MQHALATCAVCTATGRTAMDGGHVGAQAADGEGGTGEAKNASESLEGTLDYVGGKGGLQGNCHFLRTVRAPPIGVPQEGRVDDCSRQGLQQGQDEPERR